ncbi:hypothetical protein GGR56DRAFT_675450 [Xylariaceae sp. FL0804]|nr:hypothetical protein GGR56DRAFT_675450 [Xylariaceae sp. FL0804]
MSKAKKKQKKTGIVVAIMNPFPMLSTMSTIGLLAEALNRHLDWEDLVALNLVLFGIPPGYMPKARVAPSSSPSLSTADPAAHGEDEGVGPDDDSPSAADTAATPEFTTPIIASTGNRLARRKQSRQMSIRQRRQQPLDSLSSEVRELRALKERLEEAARNSQIRPRRLVASASIITTLVEDGTVIRDADTLELYEFACTESDMV